MENCQRNIGFIISVKYGHSDLVRRESAQRAAHIDVNDDYSIEDHYQTCIRLARIDTDTSTGTSNLREPDTALAAIIGQQLKNPGRGGKGYVPDDSSIDSRSTTGSSASSGNANPATQAYIERQKKATGKSAKKIISSIECNKCGKIGHVEPDCRSSIGKERKQPETDRRIRETELDPSLPPAFKLLTRQSTTTPTTRSKADSSLETPLENFARSSRTNIATFTSTSPTSCQSSS
jgi:hypothetical protein